MGEPFPRVAHRGGDSAASRLYPWLHSCAPPGRNAAANVIGHQTPRTSQRTSAAPTRNPRFSWCLLFAPEGPTGCSHGRSAVRRQSDQAQPVVPVAQTPLAPAGATQGAFDRNAISFAPAGATGELGNPFHGFHSEAATAPPRRSTRGYILTAPAGARTPRPRGTLLLADALLPNTDLCTTTRGLLHGSA